MTILSVVKDVCAVVGVEQPQSIFSNIAVNRTMQEMLALANEMATRLACDFRDWTMMRTTATLLGNGVTQAFPLPANYRRMLVTSNVYRSDQPIQPMRFVPDLNDWTQRRLANRTEGRGEWIINGGSIYIFPVMPTGVTAIFNYVDKNCVIPNAGGGFTETFVNDGDIFRLDERLLKLGMIWQWKAQKGGPGYAEDMGTYQDAVFMAAGRDGPAPIIIDRLPSSAALVAYPWPVTGPAWPFP